jgi:hypothetical protein
MGAAALQLMRESVRPHMTRWTMLDQANCRGALLRRAGRLRAQFVLFVGLLSSVAPSPCIAQDSTQAQALVRRGERALRDSLWTRAIAVLDSATLSARSDSATLRRARYLGSLGRLKLASVAADRANRGRDCASAQEGLRLVSEADSLLALVPIAPVGDPAPVSPRVQMERLVRRFCH